MEPDCPCKGSNRIDSTKKQSIVTQEAMSRTIDAIVIGLGATSTSVVLSWPASGMLSLLFLTETICIPETSSTKLLPGFLQWSLPAFVPILLISIGYVDPEKWVATVEGCARFGFDLMAFNFAAIFSLLICKDWCNNGKRSCSSMLPSTLGVYTIILLLH